MTPCAWRFRLPTTRRWPQRRPLTDEEITSVLTKEVKSRRESVEAYEKAGREDLADKERREAGDPLASSCRSQLTEDELRAMVRCRHRRDRRDLGA